MCQSHWPKRHGVNLNVRVNLVLKKEYFNHGWKINFMIVWPSFPRFWYAALTIHLELGKGLLYKNWPIPGLYFCLFQANSTICATNLYDKMCIQHSLLGFEPTTSWTRFPPITTRQGHPSWKRHFCAKKDMIPRVGNKCIFFIKTYLLLGKGNMIFFSMIAKLSHEMKKIEAI